MATALPDTRADPCAALPHALSLRVFGGVSVEERLRCREVCRGWCATLADHTLWLRLDMTRADGAACSEALLLAATARAGGQLQALRLTCAEHRVFEALLSVAAANNTTLQELRVRAHDPFTQYACVRVATLEALLRAAPQLHMLEADVHATGTDEAHRVLRNNPPFGPLRVRQFAIGLPTRDVWNVLALIADVAAHVWLTGLHLTSVDINDPAALDAVMDAALAHRLSAVQLRVSRLSPASVPALVRLLGGNALVELHILNLGAVLLNEPADAALLGDALRANTSLTALRLSYCALWHLPAAGIALCAALAGHPRLRAIDLSYNSVCKNADACAALAALVAANAPALQTLGIGYCGLGDQGMGPVVEALRHNTHLTKLDCGGNEMSKAFARDRLLPAVRANASLRELTVVDDRAPYGAPESAHEAAALVAARAQQSRTAAAN